MYPRTSRPDVTFLQILKITSIVGGLQVIWSVILANGTTHLLSLGLPEAWTPLVWVMAPLCGVLVQPMMGVFSDQCQSSLGKRRPFIIGGTLGTVLSMLVFAWAADIMSLIFSAARQRQNGYDGHSLQTSLAISLALASVLAFNFCMQPIQMAMRALIVDSIPTTRQARANTIASCWVGLGNITGHLAGSIDLGGFSKLERYQCLTLIGCLSLIVTAVICCVSADETPCIAETSWKSQGINPLLKLKDILNTYSNASWSVKKVFHVQFFVWMAWFPFLFYGSTYMAEKYTASMLTRITHGQAITAVNNSFLTEARTTIMNGQGARTGSLTYLSFSIVAFIANIAIPLTSNSRGTRSRPTLARYRGLWTCCHALHAACLILIPSPQSWLGSATLIIYAGIPWAVTQWLPYAVLGEELALEGIDRNPAASSDNGSCYEEEVGKENKRRNPDRLDVGTIMGLHNVVISTPQIIAAVLSSVILRGVEAAHGTSNGIEWVFRASALPALAAVYLSIT